MIAACILRFKAPIGRDGSYAGCSAHGLTSVSVTGAPKIPQRKREGDCSPSLDLNSDELSLSLKPLRVADRRARVTERGHVVDLASRRIVDDVLDVTNERTG